MQLCDGASAEERKKWFLRPAQEFHYLNQSSCYNLNRVDNADEFQVFLDPHLPNICYPPTARKHLHGAVKSGGALSTAADYETSWLHLESCMFRIMC